MAIKEIFKEAAIDKSKLPKHVALTLDGCRSFSAANKIPYSEVNIQKFFNLKNIARVCVKLGIPIFTFYVLPSSIKDQSQITEIVDGLADFFSGLPSWDFIAENKIKVSVIGKWYDLPGRVVEPIKKVIDETKDYDNFFLNICINYDGQQEIVDAARLIAAMVKSGRLDPDRISRQDIKDNIYSSYFLPPDLIVKNGKGRKLEGFMLWDSPNSKIFFSGRLWPEFSKLDFLKALEFCQKN